MTNTQLKSQIDSAITNKTVIKSITPSNVGTNIKSVVDYCDQLVVSKIYAVGLSQSGINPPTIYYEYKNDLTGGIVWSRLSMGQYIGTITTNEFTIKTFFPTAMALIGGICSVNTTSSNTFILRTWSTVTNTFSDDLLNGSQFKIEIYN